MNINIKTFTLIYILLLVLAGLAFAGTNLVTSPSFCFSCHEMRPEFYTWQASSHRQFRCLECHRINALRMAYRHISGTYYAPIQLLRPLSGAVCQKCHNLKNREVTASGDVIIPHELHERNRVECSKCHSGVAHGAVASQKVTFRTDYRKWDELLGRNWMNESRNSRPSMEVCMNCHRLRAAPLACTACHRSGMRPASRNREGCLTCHNLTPGAGGQNPVACNTCHNSNHSQDWQRRHPYPVGSNQSLRKECFSCHSQETCSNCHKGGGS